MRTKPRVVTPAEAVACVRDGDRIYLHGAAATPMALVGALVARGSELSRVELVHLRTEAPAPYISQEFRGRFRHNALFIGANVREAVQRGDADYTPVFLSDIPSLFRPGGPLQLDVAFVQVAPADQRGNYSLGVSVECAVSAIEQARIVVAQVNRRMPRTVGTTIPSDAITCIVEEDRELFEAEVPPIAPEATAIGKAVAELVPNGARLQLGIGAIPNALLSELGDHRDLGVHTEMFSDGLIPLITSGVVNGRMKSLHNGVVVTAFVMGSRQLYDFVDGNWGLEFLPADYTNDVDIIAAHDHMVAVNSVLGIDLTGQVAADSIGTKFFSGIGGQVDFIRGAARSRGGVPVMPCHRPLQTERSAGYPQCSRRGLAWSRRAATSIGWSWNLAQRTSTAGPSGIAHGCSSTLPIPASVRTWKRRPGGCAICPVEDGGQPGPFRVSLGWTARHRSTPRLLCLP